MGEPVQRLPAEPFSDQNMRTLAFSLIGYLKEFGIEERPLDREAAAAHLNCSVSTVDRLVKRGQLVPDYLGDIPMFFPSKLNEALKKGNLRHR